MKFRNDGRTLLLRLDKGEELLSVIEEVCGALNITGASVSGIGAADYVAISAYLPKKDIFREDVYKGVLEIISLNGNVSEARGEIKAHLHALFAYTDEDEKIRLTGGHLKAAVISHTAEIFITALNPIERKKNKTLNFDIWDI